MATQYWPSSNRSCVDLADTVAVFIGLIGLVGKQRCHHLSYQFGVERILGLPQVQLHACAQEAYEPHQQNARRHADSHTTRTAYKPSCSVGFVFDVLSHNLQIFPDP